MAITVFQGDAAQGNEPERLTRLSDRVGRILEINSNHPDAASFKLIIQTTQSLCDRIERLAATPAQQPVAG